MIGFNWKEESLAFSLRISSILTVIQTTTQLTPIKGTTKQYIVKISIWFNSKLTITQPVCQTRPNNNPSPIWPLKDDCQPTNKCNVSFARQNTTCNTEGQNNALGGHSTAVVDQNVVNMANVMNCNNQPGPPSAAAPEPNVADVAAANAANHNAPHQAANAVIATKMGG